jgi:CRISPR-associated protein Cas5a/b/c
MSEFFYSKVYIKFHWGFSVVSPLSSKSKSGLLLPPPTTLIGALSYGKFRGKDLVKIGGKTCSPAKNFDNIIAAARYEDNSAGIYIEDIVRNVVTYFQRPERRKEKAYRYNIVPTGKIYSPNGEIIVVFITDKIQPQELEKLSWSIIRIGSKEGIVSVENVEIGKVKKVSGRVTTKYYFPATVKHDASPFIKYIDFWEGGQTWGEEGEKKTYAVPISSFPLYSVEVKVEAEEAYDVGGEIVVVN